MFDAAEPKTPISKSGSGKWHPVSIKHDRLSILGGYSSRPEAGTCLQYQVGDRVDTFLELDKNAMWFLKGVGGGKTQKGYLKPVLVIDMIRHAFKIKLTGGAAVADLPEEDVDPMDALDDITEVVPEAKTVVRKKKGNAKKETVKIKRKLFRTEPQQLEVATRPACAASGLDDKTMIWIYQGQQGRTNIKHVDKNLFLRVDSIDWLLAYAADELHFQGVEASSNDDKGSEQSPNCTAVADLFVEYAFGINAWEATFVAGELAGTVKCVTVRDLNKDMWQKLKEVNKVDGYLTTADFRERKSAAKEFLILWCEALAGAKPEAAEFEALAASPTKRGEKRSLENAFDAAVAAEEDDEDDAAVAEDVHHIFFDEDDAAVAAEEADNVAMVTSGA